MILALDIGNSNIVISCMDDNKTYFMSRLDTNVTKTEDEYAMNIQNILQINKIDKSLIEGAIISSVVPPLISTHKNAIKKLLGFFPIVINASQDIGLSVKIDEPSQLGSDLICGAVAGIENYKLPLVIFDIGTATTVSVIDKNKNFIGGLIYPGPKISLETLSNKTAQLPHINPDSPQSVIAKNTVDSMVSGVIFGNASMIDGIISRIEKELGQEVNVVATGGLSQSIIPYCERNIHRDDDLIFKGIFSIYKKLKNKSN